MLGRFSAKKAVQTEERVAEPARPMPQAEAPTSAPEAGDAPRVAMSPAVAPAPVAAQAAPEPAPNNSIAQKLLDAKVRLHRRLIEELNLAALEKLPEADLKREIHT